MFLFVITFVYDLSFSRYHSHNTNPFLNKKSSWYEDGVIGLKTGTLRGWNNLFSIFKKNNGNYYGIITVGFENRKDVNILTKELIRRIKNESINSKGN